MTNIEYFIKLVNDFKLKVFENGNVRNKLTGQFVEYWSDIYKEYMISNYDVNLNFNLTIKIQTNTSPTDYRKEICLPSPSGGGLG